MFGRTFVVRAAGVVIAAGLFGATAEAQYGYGGYGGTGYGYGGSGGYRYDPSLFGRLGYGLPAYRYMFPAYSLPRGSTYPGSGYAGYGVRSYSSGTYAAGGYGWGGGVRAGGSWGAGSSGIRTPAAGDPFDRSGGSAISHGRAAGRDGIPVVRLLPH